MASWHSGKYLFAPFLVWQFFMPAFATNININPGGNRTGVVPGAITSPVNFIDAGNCWGLKKANSGPMINAPSVNNLVINAIGVYPPPSNLTFGLEERTSGTFATISAGNNANISLTNAYASGSISVANNSQITVSGVTLGSTIPINYLTGTGNFTLNLNGPGNINNSYAVRTWVVSLNSTATVNFNHQSGILGYVQAPGITLNYLGDGFVKGSVTATNALIINIDANSGVEALQGARISGGANSQIYIKKSQGMRGNPVLGSGSTVTISGSGNLTGNLTATSATVTLSNSGGITGNVSLGTGSSVVISNSGGIGGSLDLKGTGSLSISGSGRIAGGVSNSLGSGATTVTLDSSGGIDGTLALYSGSSVLMKSSSTLGGLNITGNGTLNLDNTTAAGNRIGAVTISGQGTINLQGGGSIGGDVNLGSNSTININSSGSINGNVSSGSGSTVGIFGSGSVVGNILFTSDGTLSLQTTFSPPVTQIISGLTNLNIYGGTFTPSNNISGLNSTLIMTPFSNLTLNKVISGTAYTEIGGIVNMNVANGLATTGALGIFSGGVINVNNDWTSNNSTISNLNNVSSIKIAAGKTFTNATTSGMTVTNNFTMTDGVGATSGGNFVNSSSLNYNTNNPTAFSFTGTYTNSAPLTVTQSLTRNAPFVNNNNAAITIAAAQTLALNSTSTFTNGSISGAGNFSVGSAGSFTMNGGSVGNTGTQTNNGVFTQNAGTVSGATTFTNANGATYNFNGGNLNSTFDNQAGATLNINANLSLNSSSSNASTIQVSPDITLTLDSFSNQGTIENNGILNWTGALSNSAAAIINNNGSLTATSTLDNAGTFNNAGTATFSAVISGAGTTNNTGTLTFNSGGSISGQTFNNQTNGIVLVNGTGSISTAINVAGSSGYSNNQLIFGRSQSGSFVLGSAVKDVRTISLESGTLQVNAAVSGVNTSFNVADGSTASFAAALSGSSVINNNGTLNFNAGSSVNTFTDINLGNNGLLTFSGGTKTLNPTNIIGAADNTNSQLYIGQSGATTLQVYGTVQDVRYINIYNGSTLNLKSGSQIVSTNGSNGVNIDGALQIDSGAFFTVNGADRITGSGDVDNNGLFTINSANLTLGGDFYNRSSGVLKINGTPTVTFGGTFTNDGELNVAFNNSNSLPFISTGTANLSKGNVIVTYENNYIATGNYTLLTASNVPTLGGYMTPPASFYIESISMGVVGNSIVVSVVRDGFGNHALTEKAKTIGNYLEFLGSNNPTQAQLDILNAFEKIENDQILTDALESLLPPDYTQQINLQMQAAMMGAIFMRLDTMRAVNDYGSIAEMSYASGDDDGDPENAVWIRPFYASGHQRPISNQVGYKSKTNGVIIGFDKQVSAPLMLGAAINYANANANDTSNTNTKTNIKNYQATLYGTYKYPYSTYLDALISAGVNKYVGTRNILLPGINTNAYSDYQTQQLTAKARVSKNIAWGYLQFTPSAMAQYSFIRQLAYAETGAGAFDIYTNPDNSNLFRLGVGTKFAIPMSSKKMLSIPAVYAQAFVDVAGGAQDTNSQFISGGPIIGNIIQPGRWMLVFGVSYEFSLTENIQIIANYDVEVRNSFNGQEAFLNLRYLF